MADLAPNGLPYHRCPPVENEWSKRSTLLANLPGDIVGTMHPCVVARPRDDVGGGMGLFVTFGIRAGEVVWAERSKAGPDITAIPRTRAWIEALPPASKRAYCHFMYKTGDDEYQSLAEFNDVPIDEFPNVRTADVSNYMNHSCSPTCWFVDGGSDYTGLMVATRNILPGEEITFDYSTSEDCELSPSWECHCGHSLCRGRVTPTDWLNADLQRRYAGHFLPHIAAKIAETNGGAPVKPLEIFEADLRSVWWLRLDTPEGPGIGPCQQPGVAAALEVDRKALIEQAATGTALELLNRQAALLISARRIKRRMSAAVGRFLETGERVAKGEIVVLLPPNLLLWDEEVPDFNTCLQIGVTDAGARLFSSSLTPDDLDNYICHSCDPNCEVQIGNDLAAALVAKRTIEPCESITFDYNTTEDDLRGDRGGFECECGAANCRGIVAGRLYCELAADSPAAADGTKSPPTNFGAVGPMHSWRPGKSCVPCSPGSKR